MFRNLSFALFLLTTLEVFPQDTLYLNSDYIPATDTTLIYLPSDSVKANPCPLLFMLHGWSGHSTKWSEVVNLDSIAKKDGFIITCPDAFFDSWYIDSPVKKNSQIEKFFFEKLIPALFEKYNIDKQNIFITGISMGGHGAIYYFLKHPDFFKSAGSTSGILDITQFPDNWGLPKVLGSYTSNKEIWQNNSDIYLLKNLKEKNKKILIDCGTEDFAFKVNQAFADSCKAAGIPVEFVTSPGTHSLAYWQRSILYHFKFFKEMVGKN